MSSPLRVLVVEDDFRIAKMHGAMVDMQEGYQLAGIAHNGEGMLAMIAEELPDLILLDVYLPDQSGIELLRVIRSQKLPCDVVLITAAKEHEIVEEGFRLGIFDYLIKPFDLNRFAETLLKFSQYKKRLHSTAELNQDILNDLLKLRSPKTQATTMQKGIDEKTLTLIHSCFTQHGGPMTSEGIAQDAGVSLSTVRNYLKYMVQQGMLQESLQYGSIGRPQRQYVLVDAKKS
ncbi:UNVERIFIED_CONTAM: response regulator of citrate/malate metabolism [Brevibacillus sp. OAP136]